MIDQATKDKFSELGFDVAKLIDAMKSDEDTSLEVPTLYKDQGHTKDELTTFGNNRFNEGKGAMSEMLAKSFKEKYGIEIEGKNIDDVFSAYGDKRFNEAKPEEGLINAKKDFAKLQEDYTSLQGKLDEKDSTHKQEMFRSGLNQKLLSLVPKKMLLSANDTIDLYLMRNNIKQDNGSAVVEKNGEILKDTLLNPITMEDHFKSWIDASGLVHKDGMGGSDSNSGSSVSKFKNTNEFMEYAKSNDINPMSPEGQKFLAENKSENFSYKN